MMQRLLGRLAGLVAMTWLVGCGGTAPPGPAHTATPTASPPPATDTTPAGVFTLRSPAFPDQGRIPATYTCLGQDRIPPLEWRGAPQGTASFVLWMDDPDAPAGVWLHWIVYDIPAAVTRIPEGGPAPGPQARNSWGQAAYGGPCPPPGPEHRYRFVLYALDIPSLGLAPAASAGEVHAAMQGHILAQATLTGRFGR